MDHEKPEYPHAVAGPGDEERHGRRRNTPIETLKRYYHLTKPGIIRGNVLAAIAGFLLAAHGHIDVLRGLALVLGVAFVIASACVVNNYIDRHIDARMERTRHRALVEGTITPRAALVYAALLGIMGFGVLLVGTNPLTLAIGIVGWLAYVVLYGYGKRHTVHGTLIGTISGATPPVAGYAAVTGQLDLAAWLLFAILVVWQMAHFFAIALYRRDDYAAAGLPVLSVVKSAGYAKLQIVLYVIAFIVACGLLTLSGHAGYSYLGVMSAVGFGWLVVGLYTLRGRTAAKWGKGMFLYSLIAILVLCVMLSVDSLLP